MIGVLIAPLEEALMAGVPAPSAGWNMKPVRRPRRREPLLPPSLAADRRWYKRKRWALALALATLVVIRLVVAAAAHRRQPPFPYCRKSALVAVLDATEGGGGDGRGGSGGGGNGHGDSASQHLIVWAGQGLHKAIRPDLAAFDLRSNRWLGPLHPPGELGVDVPVPRWKAGNAQARKRVRVEAAVHGARASGRDLGQDVLFLCRAGVPATRLRELRRWLALKPASLLLHEHSGMLPLTPAFMRCD